MADTPVVHRWSGREARLLRQALRLSMRAFAEHLGVAVRTVAKWEARLESARPKPDNQAVLDSALRQADDPSRELFGLLLRETRGSQPDPALPREDDVHRRELFGLAGGAIVGGCLSHVEPLRRRVDLALAHPTSSYDAEEWERTADHYAHLVGRMPTSDVMPQLLADLDEARIRTENAGDDTRSRMVRVCGLLSALIAICLVKVGSHIEAGRYWRTAQRAAQMFDDGQLHALVRGRRAVYALYGDASLRAILRLTDDAINIAGDIPSVGAVSALAARAQVFAQHGFPTEARAALVDVEAVFERLPDPVRSAWDSQWGWTEQRLRFVRSWVHSYSGRLSDAAEAQDAALAQYPASFRTASAQVQLHRAACMVQSGDPSEGARHTTRTLEVLPPYLRREVLIRHSASLVFDAMPRTALNLPAVKEVREVFALSASSPGN